MTFVVCHAFGGRLQYLGLYKVKTAAAESMTPSAGFIHSSFHNSYACAIAVCHLRENA